MEYPEARNTESVFDAVFKAPDTIEAAIKFHGLVLDIIEDTAKAGVVFTYKNARIIIGLEGASVVRTLGEICTVSSGNSPMFTEEEALNIIALDVSQKAFIRIRSLGEHNHYKRVAEIRADLDKYLQDHYLEPLQNGKRTISDIFYFQKPFSPFPQIGGGSGGFPGDEEYPAIEPVALGETPDDLLLRGMDSEYVVRVQDATREVIQVLFNKFQDSFQYLIALIESSLLVRESQTRKPKSKRTATVHQDMSALFMDSLCALHLYNHARYVSVFGRGYNPFTRLGCGGRSNKDRTQRNRNKKALLAEFLCLLEAALAKRLTASETKSIIGAIRSWLEEIKIKVEIL